MNSLKELITKNKRYSKFIILDTPIPLKTLFKDKDIKLLQFHDITPIDEDNIIGFCGQCTWKNNTLIPLDGDIYNENPLVYGYEENAAMTIHPLFGYICIQNIVNILVKDW